jgi:hypothetical protein
MFAEPQRHRDTEKAQSHPPTSQTRRHEGTKTSQSPPTHPVETADHADRRRCVHTDLLCGARFRPSDGGAFRVTSSGETPWPSNGHGITGSGNRLESELSCRFPDPVVCALAERRSRHFSSSFNGWVRHAPSPKHAREERQNRRAKGALAGEKTGDDGCLYPESSGFSPAAGDHSIACRSAANKRDRLSRSAFASLRLCVFAPLRSLRFVVGRVDLRYLRDLRANWVGGWIEHPASSIQYRVGGWSWCLGGSKTTQHS